MATAVARSAISVVPLGARSHDAIGLAPASKAGLPEDLWGPTPAAELARLIRAERIDTLPAVQALLYTLLLTEFRPPVTADPDGAFFVARIDKLLDLGALDPALALLEQVETPTPEMFRRWFDIALLTGQEDRACDLMRGTPGLAPTFPAQVFCLARGGDWNAAALSLRTGETLGYIDADMSALLERFLDPGLFEDAPHLPAPARPSPLVLRLMEAIGQAIPTATLPVAFAQADLRSNAGWKTRLEAGERLARTSAIEANRLLGLYTERKPAASGGIWERVSAVQKLDEAVQSGDTAATAAILPKVWSLMAEAELEVAFAALYGKTLAAMDLGGSADTLALRIGLMSGDFAAIAGTHRPRGAEEEFLIAIAGGQGTEAAPPDQMGAAVEAAFASEGPVSAEFATMLADRRIGEVILHAIDQITDGARGDLRDVTEGLRLLRHAGLETTARRAALELVLLERRG